MKIHEVALAALCLAAQAWISLTVAVMNVVFVGVLIGVGWALGPPEREL